MYMTLMIYYHLLGCSSPQPKPENSINEDDTAVSDTAEEVEDTVIVDSAEEDSAEEDIDTDVETEDPIDTSPKYHQAYFASTHNSYSGEARGSIIEQLNAGIRGFEFDIHDNEFYSLRERTTLTRVFQLRKRIKTILGD